MFQLNFGYLAFAVSLYRCKLYSHKVKPMIRSRASVKVDIIFGQSFKSQVIHLRNKLSVMWHKKRQKQKQNKKQNKNKTTKFEGGTHDTGWQPYLN